MLKLTYTESDFYMERLAQSPEQLVALRVILAMRVGQKIVVQPSSAAFLLPINLPELSMLEVAVRDEGGENIALCVADDEFAEVSLGGNWITLEPEQQNGIFIAALSDRIELLLFNLWQATEENASVILDG
ncbi:alr0857 family protein [Okeania sp.]|uniref:alr0857 family protein n=1 Tax=Okeania sp. TaxID=3100323 RepID=UPI002B4AEEF4|nr:alr0857 family protein [Okeania sp.]MEB3341461.1 hypothetical protein [Okeania sp.]